MRNGNITKIDFNNGDGSYKMELSNLTENNIKEIEMLAEQWRKNDDNRIYSCISMILTDATERRFKEYGVSLKDCIEWFEEKIKVYTGKGQKVKLDQGNEQIDQNKITLNPDNEPIDPTNAPTAYGKYVDECLTDAAKHYFSRGNDTYTLADVFYAGMLCERNYKGKSEK